MHLVREGTYPCGPGGTDQHVDAFYTDVYEVTNERFAAFVEQTHYRTSAETDGGTWD